MNYSSGATNVSAKGRSGNWKGDSVKKKENQTFGEQLAELVSADPDQRNWRGICIALLVIATVCSLIVTAIFLLTPGIEGPRVKNPRFTLEEVISGQLKARSFNGSWISDKEFIFRDYYGTMVVYNAETLTMKRLMSNVTFRQMSAFDYSVSKDMKYVMLAYDMNKGSRYSYTAKYRIYDISTRNEHFDLNGGNSVQYVSWGPSGSQMVYVQNNNLYYIHSADHHERQQQLINTGVEGVIYNGIPDWLYENEIFLSNKALWWSNDGTKLCFASFNDSLITPLEYTKYGSYKDINNIYPTNVEIRYPKASQTIPTPSLRVVELNKFNSISKPILPPKEYRDIEYYITAVKWIDSSRLSIIWLKRMQNSSIVTVCRHKSNIWNCEKHAQIDSYGEGWLEMNQSPLFTDDRKRYFLRVPVADADAGSFRHVTSFNIETGRRDYLTHGKYDVTKIVAYNGEENTVYFIKTLPDKPGERHLASVTDTTANISRIEKCLSCDLYDECLYNEAIFSPGAKYYILECLGPGVPKVEVRSVSDNNLVEVLDRNDYLRSVLDKRALPQVRTFQVSLKNDYKANVRMFLPPGLRDDEITKYPMLVNADGSPGSQTVSEKFKLHWGTYLASKKNYIYVWVDGRGSGFQGDKRLYEVYRQLGSMEVEDYITVTKYLKEHLPFISTENTAIWGWGYGGYTSALALAEQDTPFQCAISVAPITSWTYHDAVYTERYMQMPESPGNYIGYEKSDITRKGENFKGKKFLLVHGTADEMVHLQHSMMLMKALTDAGVIYRAQIYPDENHDLANVKFHFYLTMEDFLEQCFRTEEIIAVSEKSAR
uniref:Venom dipeptidyl peptidase 4 n=1 Tax=Hadrurus spadix TaxID=141984 RepID=A0A1W7RAN4_9SCOR